jgi:hypothetical protein
MSRKLFASLTLLAWTATAFAAPAPQVKPATPKKDEGVARGQTVVLGTWTWDIAKNTQGGGGDVWWEQVTETERNLVFRGGAGWAIVKGKAFEKVGVADLRKAIYSREKLPGTSLRPGTVVAIRTRTGGYAKVKVVRYRELHDTSFPEARHLRPEWIRFARTRPNTREYHLEVQWVLFGDKR